MCVSACVTWMFFLRCCVGIQPLKGEWMSLCRLGVAMGLEEKNACLGSEGILTSVGLTAGPLSPLGNEFESPTVISNLSFHRTAICNLSPLPPTAGIPTEIKGKGQIHVYDTDLGADQFCPLSMRAIDLLSNQLLGASKLLLKPKCCCCKAEAKLPDCAAGTALLVATSNSKLFCCWRPCLQSDVWERASAAGALPQRTHPETDCKNEPRVAAHSNKHEHTLALLSDEKY